MIMRGVFGQTNSHGSWHMLMFTPTPMEFLRMLMGCCVVVTVSSEGEVECRVPLAWNVVLLTKRPEPRDPGQV